MPTETLRVPIAPAHSAQMTQAAKELYETIQRLRSKHGIELTLVYLRGDKPGISTSTHGTSTHGNIFAAIAEAQNGHLLVDICLPDNLGHEKDELRSAIERSLQPITASSS